MTKIFIVLMFLALLWLSGCSPDAAQAQSEKPAVVINQLQLTVDELKQEFQVTGVPAHASEVGRGGEPDWLSLMIERELLVQEAQRFGLDRQKDFMRTIERFWKEALIKSLLDRKGKEIGDRIHVYEPEIETRYQKLQAEYPEEALEPLSEVRDEIHRALREEKQAQAMEAWLDELRKKSKIQIDQEALKNLR